MNVTDPLALVALEAGLITNPLQDKAAGGNSQLDTQQHAAVSDGHAVPGARVATAQRLGVRTRGTGNW